MDVILKVYRLIISYEQKKSAFIKFILFNLEAKYFTLSRRNYILVSSLNRLSTVNRFEILISKENYRRTQDCLLNKLVGY